MEIKVQSIKFDADQKLLDYIDKMDVEMVKRFIPMNDYVADLKVQKAVDLVMENAVAE